MYHHYYFTVPHLSLDMDRIRLQIQDWFDQTFAEGNYYMFHTGDMIHVHIKAQTDVFMTKMRWHEMMTAMTK